jgi:hypothetical protein
MAMQTNDPKAAIPIGNSENGNGAIGAMKRPMLSVIETKTTKKHTTAHFEAPVFEPCRLAI